VLAAVLIKFFPYSSIIILTLLVVVMGMVFFLYGLMRYTHWKKKINQT